jgi:hypothetical protein
MSLENYRKTILSMFGANDVIKYSIGKFDGDWGNLEANVREWWRLYKDWEKSDTLEDAFEEQRLTVKGTALRWEMDLEAQDPQNWGATSKYEKPKGKVPAVAAKYAQQQGPTYYPMQKGLKGITARLDPKVFMPGPGRASQKTEQGLHDQSAGLMHKGKPISEQQYKTPDRTQYFVFMPLSHPGDQAVYQNINMLAKAHRTEHADFYNLVRDIRSKMTRIKLAAEHDMSTSFAMVGKTATGRPKFSFTLLQTTDVSVKDVERKVIGSEVTFEDGKNVARTLTTPGILEARRNAAINFQALILGQIHSYGEVVVAYRQHAGKFPKFAQFDEKRKVWKVGELTGEGNWKFKKPEETFLDQPLKAK